MHKRVDSKSMEKKRKKTVEKSYPVALTIAGSDSGGGAGIQADLRTFNAFGVYGCSAVTAVTCQNPREISRIEFISAEAVSEQIGMVAGAFDLAFAKSGMLGSIETVKAVAAAVEKYKLQLICDPVMISTSETRLFSGDVLETMKKELFPRAAWLMPNIPEAEVILQRKIGSFKDMCDGALELAGTYGCSVWLKGGHLAQNVEKGIGLRRMSDVICVKNGSWKISSLMAEVPKYTSHGTGCTLSAALTATLALELPWQDAVCESRAFVLGALVENVRIGNGISAMYPSGNDYTNSIQFEEVRS